MEDGNGVRVNRCTVVGRYIDSVHAMDIDKIDYSIVPNIRGTIIATAAAPRTGQKESKGERYGQSARILEHFHFAPSQRKWVSFELNSNVAPIAPATDEQALAGRQRVRPARMQIA